MNTCCDRCNGKGALITREGTIRACSCGSVPYGMNVPGVPAPHPLDARALEARLADRDVIIGVLRDRCMKLEAAISDVLATHVVESQADLDAVTALAKALEVLPPVKPC